MKRLPDILGWYGAIAILVAFACVSFGVLSAHSISYQLISLTGAIGLLTNGYAKGAYPNAVLNTIYALIALVALFLILT